MYVYVCMYVCMYVWMYVGWWLAGLGAGCRAELGLEQGALVYGSSPVCSMDMPMQGKGFTQMQAQN